MRISRRVATFLAALVPVTGLAACANVQTTPGEFACAYGNGPIEAKKLKSRHGPGERSFSGINDIVISGPADKRNWVFSSQQIGQTEAPRSFDAVMADSIPMLFEGSVDLKFYGPQFCDLVNEIRNKYDLGSDGGRQQFLDIEFGTALEAAFNRVAKRYAWEPVYENTIEEGGQPTQEQFGREVGVEAQRILRERLSGINALCGPDVKASIDEGKAGECSAPLVILTKAEPPAQCGDRPGCVELTERRQVEEQAKAEADARVAQAREGQRAAEESQAAAVAQAAADQARIAAEADTARAQALKDHAACAALGLNGMECVQLIQAQALATAADKGNFPSVIGGDASVIVGPQGGQ